MLRHNKTIIIAVVVFALSFLFMDMMNGKLQDAKNELNQEESYLKNLQDEIKMDTSRVKDADTQIKRVESSSENLEADMEKNVEKFIKIIKTGEEMTEDERSKFYSKSLEEVATGFIAHSSDTLDISMPDEYKLLPGTSRNKNLSVLVVDTKRAGLGYTEIFYDSNDKKVIGVTEYATDFGGGA